MLITSAAQIGLPVLIIGMHLCGHLSTIAVHLFLKASLARQIILCPCCLPAAASEATPKEIYKTKIQIEQYQRWAVHLKELVAHSVPTTLEYNSQVLSERCAIIHGTKPPGETAAANPAVAATIALIRGACWAVELQLEEQMVSVDVMNGGGFLKIVILLKNVGGGEGDQSVAAVLRRPQRAEPQQPMFFSKVRQVGPAQQSTFNFKLKRKHFNIANGKGANDDIVHGAYELVVRTRAKNKNEPTTESMVQVTVCQGDVNCQVAKGVI